MIVIAHNIRSLHNVGSIFRSAEAFNIEKVYLTGYTGMPPRKEIAKVALGSEHRVPWEYQVDIKSVIHGLKGQGVKVLALETGAKTVPIREASEGNVALIVGNEVEGIEPEILGLVDQVVNIPMLGQKKSLNVSVAAGIAMFELTRKKM